LIDGELFSVISPLWKALNSDAISTDEAALALSSLIEAHFSESGVLLQLFYSGPHRNRAIIHLTECLRRLKNDMRRTHSPDLYQLLDSFQRQNPLIVNAAAAATNTQSSTSKSTSSIFKPASNTPVDDSRKYNILLFGLKECAKGTNRSDCMNQELDQIVEIFGSIEKNIGPQNIRNSFRLGKYNESSSRPRPILIKFNRSYDVSTLLAA